MSEKKVLQPNNYGVFTALDMQSDVQAIQLAKKLVHISPYFKIGLRMFIRYGPNFVKKIQDIGGCVFLDLKLFDIPHTVQTAVESIVHLGVFMTTIHVQGGRDMIRAAVRGVQGKSQEKKTKLIGVTVLTSWSEEEMKALSQKSLQTYVAELANLANEENLDGVVSSALEVKDIKENWEHLLTVTPGIRFNKSPHQDQKRVVSPQEAKKNGAHFLVVGREVITASRPQEILEKIVNDFI